MPKVLKSFEKDFEVIRKAADGLVDRIDSAEAALITRSTHLATAAKEVGRAVQEARDAGVQGTRLSDFAGVPDVRTALAEGPAIVDTMRKHTGRLVDVIAEARKLRSGLESLAMQVDADIDFREGKARNKPTDEQAALAGDAGKLLARIDRLHKVMATQGIGRAEAILGDFAAAAQTRIFDDAADEAFARTKAQRSEDDTDALMGQLGDPRFLNATAKQIELAKKRIATDLPKAAAALDASEDGSEEKAAEKVLKPSRKILKGLKVALKAYQKVYSALNAEQKAALRSSKRMRHVVALAKDLQETIFALELKIEETERQLA